MRPRNRFAWSYFFTVVAVVVLTACAEGDGKDIGSPIVNGTTPDGIAVEPPVTTLPAPVVEAIRVPADYSTIQEAVDIAQPGDLILIDPGNYFESVVISTPDVVVRGRNRNLVFIDGQHTQRHGITVNADGVSIENLTVRNYTNDAINIEGSGDVPLNRSKLFHVTTSNTERHGIDIENAQNVLIEQVWASGHGGAGVHIRGCTDCAIRVTTTLVEFSNAGFWIDGVSQAVRLDSVTARSNRLGVSVSRSGAGPISDVVITGSDIQNNGHADTPSFEGILSSYFGVGIHLGGVDGVLVEDNTITGNSRAGVLLDEGASNGAVPESVRVRNNLVTGHPEGDLVLSLESDSALDVCLSGNSEAAIVPLSAQPLAECTGSVSIDPFAWLGTSAATIDYVNGPVPPTIDGMLDADSALPVPAGPVTISAFAD